MTKRKTSSKPEKAKTSTINQCPALADKIKGGGNWAWAYYSQPNAQEKAEAVMKWMAEAGNYKWSVARFDSWQSEDGQSWVVHYHLDNDRRPISKQG